MILQKRCALVCNMPNKKNYASLQPHFPPNGRLLSDGPLKLPSCSGPLPRRAASNQDETEPRSRIVVSTGIDSLVICFFSTFT